MLILIIDIIILFLSLNIKMYLFRVQLFQEIKEKDAALKASEKRVKQMEKDIKKLLKEHTKQQKNEDNMTAKLLLQLVVGQVRKYSVIKNHE